VEQTPATTGQAASGHPAATAEPPEEPGPGFLARGRLRRRARFLRKARELAYRDVGGLVFNLHRFGQRNDALVLAKLATLGQIDSELRALEAALHEPQPLTVLREAGITACPRCAAIHSSEDHFCPNCGLPLSRHVDLPIAAPAGAPRGTDVTLAPPSGAGPPADPAGQPGAPGPPRVAAAAPPDRQTTGALPGASPAPPAGQPRSPTPPTGQPRSPTPPVRPAPTRQTPPVPAAPPPQRDAVGAPDPERAPAQAGTDSGAGDEPTQIVRPGSGSP
jgi:hypothetical protein